MASAACGPSKGSHDEEGGAVPSPVTQEQIAVAEKARAFHAIKTVWVIVMENQDWSSIRGNPAAAYINGTLLPLGAHAERYTSPHGIHPSEPNYIWLEAGHDLGINDNDDPNENYRTTKNHLTRHLDTFGLSWKSYQEGISGEECPLSSSGRYGAKHNPMVFFDDVTDGRNPASPYCIAHVRPYGELARDLEGGKVAHYNFITPDLCNDMHDGSGCPLSDPIANGDVWLSREVPRILASTAYQEGGALFIVWDEPGGDNLAPIGMIALSPFAKPGYANTIPYTHSSFVRTVQDIFAVKPYMREAASAASLEDLFVKYP
jgi:phosphatidylinositol-3-phosphatase